MVAIALQSERVTGIEPVPTAWEAVALPLRNTRVSLKCNRDYMLTLRQRQVA